jgi:hypothetical protein
MSEFNSNSISCQLGGFTLNGNVTNGTAQGLTVITINDPNVAQTLAPSITTEFLQVNIGGVIYYLPLYQ